MSERSSIFDMIGPVMIGPSSSHTAGVVRIGKLALRLLNETVNKAEITFFNSFARTYEGHGSDRAIIAGLMGLATDDEHIRDALDIATKKNMDFEFKAIPNASEFHPNTIRVKLKGKKRKINILGVSKGGGLINIVEVDGFPTSFSGQSNMLLISVRDITGSITFITSIISNDNCNIATMTVNRQGKNDLAKLVIEIDSKLKPGTLAYLQSRDWIEEVVYLGF